MEPVENTRRNVGGNFKERDGTPTLAAAFPGASISALCAIFGARANRGHISGWRRGTRSVPQWAREIMDQHLAAIERGIAMRREMIRAKEKSPGRRRGYENLAKWKAANPR